MIRIILVLCCLVMLSACEKGLDKPQPAEQAPITSYGPDKHGVICYMSYHSHGRSLSCVYVEVENIK